jgi:hypothetical protein
MTTATKERIRGAVIGAIVVLSIGTALSRGGGQGNVFDVLVENNDRSAVPVREVNDPAHEPFEMFVNPTQNAPVSFNVPAHKRLVITMFQGFDNGNTLYEFWIAGYPVRGQPSQEFYIPITNRTSSQGGGWNYATAQTQLVFDAGTTVYVGEDDSDTSDMAGVNVSLFGYYIDEQGYENHTGY